MKRLRDDPSRVVILGAGSGGSAMLELMQDEDLVEVIGMVDHDADAPGLIRAAQLGVPVFTDIQKALVASAPCVVFNLTGNEMVEAIASDMLGTGAVIGGLEARLIWRMVTNLRDAKEKLQFQANHDELTGLYNRRHMLGEMERALHQTVRYHVPLSVVLIDLDHFKHVNDTYGHAAGDTVLRHVAQQLKEGARAGDVMGRWGGEEFLVLLPHSSLEDASQAVKKWLAAIREQSVVIPSGEAISVSFSAGVATYKNDDKNDDMQHMIDLLLARADERLYAAKNAGRGCVVDQD